MPLLDVEATGTDFPPALDLLQLIRELKKENALAPSQLLMDLVKDEARALQQDPAHPVVLHRFLDEAWEYLRILHLEGPEAASGGKSPEALTERRRLDAMERCAKSYSRLLLIGSQAPPATVLRKPAGPAGGVAGRAPSLTHSESAASVAPVPRSRATPFLEALVILAVRESQRRLQHITFGTDRKDARGMARIAASMRAELRRLLGIHDFRGSIPGQARQAMGNDAEEDALAKLDEIKECLGDKIDRAKSLVAECRRRQDTLEKCVECVNATTTDHSRSAGVGNAASAGDAEAVKPPFAAHWQHSAQTAHRPRPQVESGDVKAVKKCPYDRHSVEALTKDIQQGAKRRVKKSYPVRQVHTAWSPLMQSVLLVSKGAEVDVSRKQEVVSADAEIDQAPPLTLVVTGWHSVKRQRGSFQSSSPARLPPCHSARSTAAERTRVQTGPWTKKEQHSNPKSRMSQLRPAGRTLASPGEAPLNFRRHCIDF